MKIIYAKHLPYATGHLGDVLTEMEQVGSPTLRVMEHEGKLCAIEGSHRLAAAYEMGLVPKLVIEVPDSDNAMGGHWARVVDTLPPYEFEHVLVLDLKEF